MPTDDSVTPQASVNGESYTSLPFPPLKRSHIRHCAFDYWHPRYRSHTPKARLIPLTEPFIAYLRQDGIILPADPTDDIDADSGIFSASDAEREAYGGQGVFDDDQEDDDDADVADAWPEIHAAVQATISELGGSVIPKLNWSAPKDATWINATNSLECKTANDVYLLLKSSDFVTHDLQHAFDGTIDDEDVTGTADDGPTARGTGFHLVLRKYFQLNPSLEFRCFVRNRRLLGICQRDLNHFDFLGNLHPKLRDLIADFFDKHIKDGFPDDNFAFDVYIPPPHERVWLVDFNPWDRRTDPLLFSWLELLTLPEPPAELRQREEEVVRIPIRVKPVDAPVSTADSTSSASGPSALIKDDSGAVDDGDTGKDGNDDDDDDDEVGKHGYDGEDDDTDAEDDEINIPHYPIFRLVRKSDPEAYMFNTPKYSAHKMPRDVVDAAAAAATSATAGSGTDGTDARSEGGRNGVTNADIQMDPGRAADAAGGLREFAKSWKELLDRERGRVVDDSSGDEI